MIGNPIAHSKSPLIHKFWLEKLGLEGDYRAVRVEAAELPVYFGIRRADPNWRGCNVTAPLKLAVAAYLDEVHDFGIGAVNCIAWNEGRLTGRNTDVAGVGEALPARLETAAPTCLIGAGGAARATMSLLEVLAVFQINVISRDRSKGEALLECLGQLGSAFTFDEAESALAGSVGVINATPLGMTGFPPMPETVLSGLAGVRPRGFALDMVYDPVRTEFLRRARRQWLATSDGLTMLMGQAADSFFHFFGATAPRRYDRKLRRLLES
ncbi:MAG: shikimate dehydrogenase [Pseudomonadota bacterium]|nr:shikimate dehydrogenase [Pseudomonadota bacterium]